MKNNTLTKTEILNDLISNFIISKLHKRNKFKINENRFKPKVIYAFDFVGMSISMQEIYEKKELFALIDILDSEVYSGLFLDIGANIGNHTLFFRNYFQKIIAFEPHNLTFKLLQINTQNIEGITIHNYGLSDKEEDAIIHSHPSNYGGAHLSQYTLDQDFFKQNTNSDFAQKINLKKLDDYNFENQKISLIKIDVEGHEFSVIKGALETIKKHKPILIFEQREIDFTEGGDSELISLLINLGYRDFLEPKYNVIENNTYFGLLFNIFKTYILGNKLHFKKVNKFEKKYYSMIIAK